MTDHELDDLRQEARYRRERLALYKAKLGGRPLRDEKLRELQRSYDGAAARLKRAEAARATRPPA